MKKIVLLIFMFAFVIANCITSISAQENVYIPGKAVRKKYGPFKVGFPVQRTVYVDIINYKADEPKECNWGFDPDDDGQTVISMIVTSEKGEVLYRKNYPIIDQYGSINLRPKQVNLSDNKGALLLVYYLFNPSAEGTGVNCQFFSINQYDSFLPVTGIFPQGDEDEAKITELKINGKTKFCYTSLLWSGNFNVVQYYQIYLSGASGVYIIGDDTEPLKLPEYPIQINELKAEEQRQNGSIRLFKVAGKADKGIMKVQINKQSKVKFLGAKYIDDERRPWWLHVVVDGEEGYLNDRNEMAILGLPFGYRESDPEP